MDPESLNGLHPKSPSTRVSSVNVLCSGYFDKVTSTVFGSFTLIYES